MFVNPQPGSSRVAPDAQKQEKTETYNRQCCIKQEEDEDDGVSSPMAAQTAGTGAIDHGSPLRDSISSPTNQRVSDPFPVAGPTPTTARTLKDAAVVDMSLASDKNRDHVTADDNNAREENTLHLLYSQIDTMSGFSCSSKNTKESLRLLNGMDWTLRLSNHARHMGLGVTLPRALKTYKREKIIQSLGMKLMITLLNLDCKWFIPFGWYGGLEMAMDAMDRHRRSIAICNAACKLWFCFLDESDKESVATTEHEEKDEGEMHTAMEALEKASSQEDVQGILSRAIKQHRGDAGFCDRASNVWPLVQKVLDL